MMETANLKTPLGILKVLEAVIILAMLGIAEIGKFFPSFGAYIDLMAHCFGMTVGYLIANLVLCICYVTGDTSTQTSIFEMILHLVGALGFLGITGGLMHTFTIYSKSNRLRHCINAGLAGSVALLKLIDVILIFCKRRRQGTEEDEDDSEDDDEDEEKEDEKEDEKDEDDEKD